MISAPYFLYVRYRFDTEDFTLLNCLLAFIKKAGRNIESLDDETPILLNSIWLDPSMQGWTKEELQEGKAKICDKIYLDDVFDPFRPDARPWEEYKAKGNGAVLLGFYCCNPQRIVLFPNVIEAVAGQKEYLDLFDGCIRRSCDALTRMVLVHELGHWFTLNPQRQAARLCLPQPGYGAGDPSRLCNERCNFHETAESLANLCTWFAFQYLAKTDETRARALMATMYHCCNAAASYEYQLYWFWLVFSGISECPEMLDGRKFQDMNCAALERRILELSNWAIGNESEPLSNWAAGNESEPLNLPRQVLKDDCDPDHFKGALPGFAAPLEDYAQAANGLWFRYYLQYEMVKTVVKTTGGLYGLFDL